MQGQPPVRRNQCVAARQPRDQDILDYREDQAEGKEDAEMEEGERFRRKE